MENQRLTLNLWIRNVHWILWSFRNSTHNWKSISEWLRWIVVSTSTSLTNLLWSGNIKTLIQRELTHLCLPLKIVVETKNNFQPTITNSYDAPIFTFPTTLWLLFLERKTKIIYNRKPQRCRMYLACNSFLFTSILDTKQKKRTQQRFDSNKTKNTLFKSHQTCIFLWNELFTHNLSKNI